MSLKHKCSSKVAHWLVLPSFRSHATVCTPPVARRTDCPGPDLRMFTIEALELLLSPCSKMYSLRPTQCAFTVAYSSVTSNLGHAAKGVPFFPHKDASKMMTVR